LPSVSTIEVDKASTTAPYFLPTISQDTIGSFVNFLDILDKENKKIIKAMIKL